MKIGPAKFCGSKRPFFEQKVRLLRLQTANAWNRGGILGKLKQLV